jgi:DHA1 family multidrug resistance protein-like MFS transporter
VPLAPFWGVLGERYSRKAVIIRAEFAYVLGYLLTALATGPWELLASRIAFGFTWGHVAVMLATQSLITPGRRLGSALGVIQASMPAATAASPLWGALLIQTVGLRALWAIDAATVLIGGTALLLLLREPDVPKSAESVFARVRHVASVTARQPTVRWSFVAWFVLFCGAGAVDPFIPVVIQRLYGGPDPAVVIGLILGGYGVLTSICIVGVGRLSDRFGPTRVLLYSSAALAAITVLMGFSPTLLVFAALALIRAVPQAGTGPTLYLHLAQVLPASYRASILGFTPIPRNLGYLVSPLIAATVSVLGLPAIFIFGSFCYLASVVVARLLSRAPVFVPRAEPTNDLNRP